MSTTEEQESENPLGCLYLVAILGIGYLLFKLALAIHAATWPIWLLFFLGGLGWYQAAKRAGSWSKAHLSVLMPVTVGLGALFVLMLALNLGRIFISADELQQWEDRLIRVRLSLADWVNPSLPVFLYGLVALFLLSFLVPKLKAISIALSAQKVVSSLYIILITLTSFTFFAQVPLQEMVEDEHAKNKAAFEEGIAQYELLLREEKEKLASNLAARAVRLALSSVNDDEKRAYQEMFEALVASSEEEVSKASELLDSTSYRNPPSYELWRGETLRGSLSLSAIRNKVAAQLGSSQAAAALSKEEFSSASWSPAPAREQSKIIHKTEWQAEPPDSSRERDTQLELLTKQEARVEQQRHRTEMAAKMAVEARAGLEAFFCEVIGLGVPKFGGIVGPYVDAVVDQLSEILFQKIVERQHSAGIEPRAFLERMFLEIVRLPISRLLKPLGSAQMMPERLQLSIKQATQELVRTETQEALRTEQARIESERRAQEQARVEAERARTRIRTRTRGRGK